MAILHILISNNPTNQQQIRLVNQYLNIIREEMDVIAWSASLSELLTSGYNPILVRPWTVLCLLRGRFVGFLDHSEAANAGVTILHEYDRELRAVGAQPTTEIISVIRSVVLGRSLVTKIKLQNAWLSLYVNNLARSSHTSAIPVVWSPDCTYIASQRLYLYDNGEVTPEIDLVIFFLSSHSPSIVGHFVGIFV